MPDMRSGNRPRPLCTSWRPSGLRRDGAQLTGSAYVVNGLQLFLETEMSDHVRRLREEMEDVAHRLQMQQITQEYREGLQSLIDECRDQLGFSEPEPDDGPTMH